MKTFFVLCSLIVVTLAIPTKIEDPQWVQFKLTHQKSYESIEEEVKRYGIFNDNLKEIEEHNRLYEQGLSTYMKGVTQFTDWMHEEFVSYLMKFSRPAYKTYTGLYVRPLNVEKPSSIDWREKNVVTDVKNQNPGNCGSCWTFSATGSLEGQYALKTGKLIALSEQELLDCSNQGCEGGSVQEAFEYVKNYGLTSEIDYPYEHINTTCRRNNKPAVVQIKGYIHVPPATEADLEAAVASIGPLSITVDATHWDHYIGGIYKGECDPMQLNHAVLAVGYGTDKDNEDYWIIKNSWGRKWGEDGYIRLPRHQNKCGVATELSYPLL